MLKNYKIIILLLSILIITGCSLSKQTKQSYKTLKLFVINIETKINKYETLYEKYKTTQQYQLIKEIDQKENWQNYFNIAHEQLELLKSNQLLELSKLIEKDDDKLEKNIIRKINNINQKLYNININIKKPLKRISELQEIIKNYSTIVKNISIAIKQLDKKNNNYFIISFKTKKEFPKKEIDIKKKDNNILKLQKQIKNDFDILKNSNNFYIIDKKYKNIKNNFKLINKNIDLYLKMYKQLKTSYSKILIDEKVNFYVIIGRTSWDESSDSFTDKDYIYKPILISEKEYIYLSKQTKDIAKTGGFFTRQIKPLIDKNLWNQFNIKATDKLPRFHDSAVWWINDLPIKYYHKYLIIKNGKKTKTNWIEVPENYFNVHYKDVGLEIISKPYGYYENETIKTPSPIGINYVNNKRYGEWRKDQSGHSFWYYYGIYSFLNGNNHYTRQNYTNYRHNYYRKQPYFGTTNILTHNGYARKFKQSNHSKYKTVRGLGKFSRGRGPSGGGK